MKYNKKIKITAFLTLLFLLSPPLHAGWQSCIECNDSNLPNVFVDSTLMKSQFESKVTVTTDSGDNWRNITIGISSYFYGFSSDDKETDKTTSGNIELSANDDSGILSNVKGLSSRLPEVTINENCSGDNTENIGTAKVVSYLVKITKYIKYNYFNTGGIESVKVSREKLVQGLYNLRFNGSDAVRTFNYYKLETEKGTFKKEWFS